VVVGAVVRVSLFATGELAAVVQSGLALAPNRDEYILRFVVIRRTLLTGPLLRSNEYMSMSSSSTTTITRTAAQEANRLRWALSLARYTTQRRVQLGLTVAEAAELSGLQISEWAGLEEGWIPDDLATLRSIAEVLEVEWAGFHSLAFMAGCHRWC
jgi:hypothetical protein